MFIMLFGGTTNSQAQTTLKTFWHNVSINYKYNQMNAGMRAYIMSIAHRETSSYTQAMALLENIKNETVFQDKIFLTMYVGNRNKEGLRVLLSSMCGSYVVGNPIADYVFAKYSKDPRAIKMINANKIALETEKKKQLAKQKEELEKEELEKKKIEIERRKQEIEDSLQEENTKRIGEIKPPEFALGRWNKFIDSTLQYPDTAYNRGIGGTVEVQFTVDTLGNVTNAKAINNVIGYGLEEEAVRVINLTKWKPAIIVNTNQAIKTTRKINIRFNPPNE